jgi:hypothetical protein
MHLAREVMNPEINCQTAQDQSLAERYVAGRLPEDLRDAFEAHYFGCSGCFQELEALRSIRRALEAGPPPFRMDGGRRWALATIATLAAATLIAVWLWPRNSSRPDSVEHATTPTVPVRPAVQDLTELAQIEPPLYRPRVLRGVEATTASRFSAAMRLYQNGKFDQAVPLLEPLSAHHVDAAFFLTASYLLTGKPARAEASARQVIAAGDTPYLEEAHWLLAKALLAMNDADGARRELETVVGMQGEFRAQADAVLRKLGSTLPR